MHAAGPGTDGYERTTTWRLPEPEELAAALTALSAEQLATFRVEIVEALAAAEQQRSLEPLHAAVKAWYWSCLFMQRPGYAERVKQAEEDLRALVGR